MVFLLEFFEKADFEKNKSADDKIQPNYQACLESSIFQKDIIDHYKFHMQLQQTIKGEQPIFSWLDIP